MFSTKNVGKLAFEISSYDSVEWSKAATSDQLPVSSEQLLKIFFEKCFEESLFNFIVFPADQSHLDNIFSYKVPLPTICADQKLINNNLDQFVQLILTKRGAVIGVNGELQAFIELFKAYSWAIFNLDLVKAEADISSIFDNSTLSAIAQLPSKNLFHISHDGEPIFLVSTACH